MEWIECYGCQRKILPGETHWSVNVHREIFEEGWVIRVIDATSIAVYCEECARLRNFDEIVVPLIS